MAPVTNNPLGVQPQKLDDPELIKLMKDLSSIKIKEVPGQDTPVDVERLVGFVMPYSTWKFEEQVDLLEWITPLDLIDSALVFLMNKYPGLLLLEPSKRLDRNACEENKNADTTKKFATSMEEVNNVPEEATQSLSVLLRFLCALLRNTTNKGVFNSVNEVGDLLAAADDSIASLALEVLAALATPPSLHKQMAPEGYQHSTALNDPGVSCHRRLVALARGWGSRGAGLGLFQCVTADDSEFGQGGLPSEAGEVHFQYFAPEGDNPMSIDKGKPEAFGDSCLATIHLPYSEIVAGPLYPDVESNKEVVSEKKRRRISSHRARGMKTNSTAELFFKCIAKVGGREKIPNDRLFPLLADIRLARSFHSMESRLAAIEYRLMALIAILYAHPSQEIMSGYFQAQPELCVELIDLLRPSVSASTVSAASAKTHGSGPGELGLIESLANPTTVPYNIRNLAVETLTALVARRDGASGGLTGVARQSNILNELGVGKGLYLGLLPTLVRFTLASLKSFLISQEELAPIDKMEQDDEDIALDVGLAFLEATEAESLPAKQQFERAFVFIDTLLTLVSAVVSAPLGTAALTDCGIIPALLGTVVLESKAKSYSFSYADLPEDDMKRVRAHLRCISSQAIQIIEGSIATHTNSLTAFHDLKGVEVLISRLHAEIVEVKRGTNQMADSEHTTAIKLCSSQRVLIFSMVNCLSVVFHQESTSSSTTQSSGGKMLRKPGLTFVLNEILENVSSYGGILASLACTLISDILNSDPHVVNHVHTSGLAQAFFKMLRGEESTLVDAKQEWIPFFPPVHELITALPNVLSALALTKEGAAAVEKANPFKPLLKIFYHPKYAMPNSRCLLNETSAIIGTGLEEIMRHVPSLRSQVVSSVVESMDHIIAVGVDLRRSEEELPPDFHSDQASPVEDQRSCLMQYALNFGQIIEQILNCEEHCAVFVECGGLDAILGLFPLLIPSGTQFLANASCLSCPSIGSLAHTTTEDSLTGAFKSIATQSDSLILLKKMMLILKEDLMSTDASQSLVRKVFAVPDRDKDHALSTIGITDVLSRDPFFAMRDKEDYVEKSNALAKYLTNITIMQWHTHLLGAAIRAASQRSQDGGTGWGRNEREWKKLLSSQEFADVAKSISEFHQLGLLESCRFRADPQFESSYRNRVTKEVGTNSRLCYRLRIVCHEGAVVRDGIEIDACANIGSMEMGEIVIATDRCLNSSGVMRYRSQRGWVSELTRGHGREAIAEVIDVCEMTNEDPADPPRYPDKARKRIEYGVSSLAGVVASILARLQSSYCDFFSSLSRVVTQGVKALPGRSMTFQSGSVGAHVRSLLHIMTSNMARGFNHEHVVPFLDPEGTTNQRTSLSKSAAALYLSSLLSHLHGCLFEEKRDRRVLNLPLLLVMMNSDPFVAALKSSKISGDQVSFKFFDVVRFVFDHALDDLSTRPVSSDPNTLKNQVLGRSVAASLPPTIVVLRRLVSTSVIKANPLIATLDKLNKRDISEIIGGGAGPILDQQSDDKELLFVSTQLMGTLLLSVATVVQDVWKDPRFALFPAHVLHPITLLANEIVSGLEDVSKTIAQPARPDVDGNPSGAGGLVGHRGFVARREHQSREASDVAIHEVEFEATDEAVTRLTEMGFAHDHALEAIESTRSNRLEVAMEYALSHPPPSPASAERRRTERDFRRRLREQNEGGNNDNIGLGSGGVDGEDANLGGSADGNISASLIDNEAMDVEKVDGADEKGENIHPFDEEKELLRSCLAGWIEFVPDVAFAILSGANSISVVDDSLPTETSVAIERHGDGDKEALTVVVCSFLLGLSQKFPEKRDDVVLNLVSLLKNQLWEDMSCDSMRVRVKAGRECSFASLCHASVLFTRALPRTRIRVLQKGLVNCLVSCIEHEHGGEKLPTWLAPALLLLEVMAQPMASFSELIDNEILAESDGFDTGNYELEQVREEHKKQGEKISDLAKAIFSSSLSQRPESKAVLDDTRDITAVASESEVVTDHHNTCPDMNIENDEVESFTIPAYSSLIPSTLVETIVGLCLDFLGGEENGMQGKRTTPPGIVHSVLLLLTRLVRYPNIASHCLKLGVVDRVLSLSRSSRFVGNVGVCTILFRRLIEDELTLQTSIETEIRTTLSKLHRKQSRPASSTEKPTASLSLFIQSVTPLICRDPMAFLKAVAVTVSIDMKSKSESSECLVSLLSIEERFQKVKALGESLERFEAGEGKPKQEALTPSNSVLKNSTSGGRRSSAGKGSRGKSPHQRSSSRRTSLPKKPKKEKIDANTPVKKVSDSLGSPSNQVTWLLVGNVLSLSANASVAKTGDTCLGENVSFLWAADLIEILADLVLAIPACAAAIHRYRPKDRTTPTDPLNNFQHALARCPPPPRNVVSFLFHELLPQDRWSFQNDQDTWDRRNNVSDERQQKKNKEVYIKTKVAQTTARLLVALVARAGEGRRRVIADLAFALSGGSLGDIDGPTPKDTKEMVPSTSVPDNENRALQAWGDLCIGLAAPRSNGVSYESSSSLSYEVIRLMLDLGMCHALLLAIQRVKLQHPMAAQVCASLLIPLEVFTRCAVTDQVQAIVDKEDSNKEKNDRSDEPNSDDKKEKKRKGSRLSVGPSQRIEAPFADDAMLEAGFDVDAARNEAPAFDLESALGMIDADHEGEDEEDEDEEDEDVVIDGDVDMEEADNDDENSSEDDGSDIEDESDVETSEGSEEDSNSEDEDAIESLLDDVSEDEEDDDDDEEEDDEDDGWGMVEDQLEPGEDFFDGEANDDLSNQLTSQPNQVEGDMEDGWTRVDASSNLGGMLLGARRSAARAGLQDRGRGFMDAAEAMISTLLRTGNIESEALAEIEGSLGIRITNRGTEMFRHDRGMWAPPGAAGRQNEIDATMADRGRRSEALGTLPHVNQRSPPDIGYSTLGGTGNRWSEISSLEYIYGGPSVASGSSNYDVVSSTAGDEVEETYPTPSAVDSQLFPGGPAASTHSRTQQALHPLLCGVDLPPVNAMVSDLLSNGQRSSRRVQVNARRPGEWGSYLFSTSNGNLMRLNRGFNGASDLQSPLGVNSGLVGWTDDGLTLDATLGDFGTAFERALAAVGPVHEDNRMAQRPECQAEDSRRSSGDNVEERPSIEREDRTIARSAVTDSSVEDTLDIPGSNVARDPVILSSSTSAVERACSSAPDSSLDVSGLNVVRDAIILDSSTSTVERASSSALDGNNSSDGEGVASSLAAGLRLSPEREESEPTEGEPTSMLSPVRADMPHESSHQSNEENRDTPAETLDEIPDAFHDPEHLSQNAPNANGLVCPPGMDMEVFNCLPVDMQREVVGQHQTAADVAAQLDATSGLDPEILAALPEDMRQEIIAQEQRERQMQAPADPSNAEEMDNASFLASLGPDLREEILLTADETFLSSLPPNILAEARLLRERASIRQQTIQDGRGFGEEATRSDGNAQANAVPRRMPEAFQGINASSSTSRKKSRPGHVKVDIDRERVIYLPKNARQSLEIPIGTQHLKVLIRLMFLLSPVRPQRLLQKLFQNLSVNNTLRGVLASAFTKLLNDDGRGLVTALSALDRALPTETEYDDFPPDALIGAAPEVLDSSTSPTIAMFRRRQISSAATSIAANLPSSARGSSSTRHIPPVVSTRVVDTLTYLGKNSPRFCLDMLSNDTGCDYDRVIAQNSDTCFEELLDLLSVSRYTKSSSNLEQLLTMLETFVAPLSSLPREGEKEHKLSERELDSAAGSGKEWVPVPRIVVSPPRLKLLCSILKMESCRDSAFSKVNSITRRLCNVATNRGFILDELAFVAQALGDDAIRDLRALSIRMTEAAAAKKEKRDVATNKEEPDIYTATDAQSGPLETIADHSSSSVTLSSSSSELKLLRVLQTLQSLCIDDVQDDLHVRKQDASNFVTMELIGILNKIHLGDLWEQLSACLNAVKILEGISNEGVDEKNLESDNVEDENDAQLDHGSETNTGTAGKKLQNNVAGLLTRFLPSIEAFFVVNASATRSGSPTDDEQAMDTTDLAQTEITFLVGGKQVSDFVSDNRILLNVLIRSNPVLLEKGLKSMVQVSRFRCFLDFDVKRQWFKTQIRRLRQQASRRHGNLRLIIRRKNVFEEAYHQLRLRNEDEMRSRLHITFRNEEGVDAGGLSREFFGILAKEMFNPNYALFTSTEDGCTFQPNQHSSINPDHLSYFRFVGRIVGKALADGFLLDAHFTRSLYKHMLGIKPTHHDMEAIDSDYYNNLKAILEYSLADIGLELTFSIEDHSFGRNQVIDLIPDGRNIIVTDETKAKYVSLVCQHRMTNAIQSQIKAYLDGFHELISPELIAVFTPRELELLISGLPDIDILDLKQNTEYHGWKASDTEIEWFWNILVSLSRSQKASFLQFVTGSSKVPLGGFSELQGMRGIQKFSIHKVGGSSGALMSAHTCFNSVDLPVYKSEEEMKAKFLYAISEGQGSFMFA